METQNLEVANRFVDLDGKESLEEYNFEHFQTKHLLADAQRTIVLNGIQPGEIAPDFEMPQAGGGAAVRLGDLRGAPVVLHFGSYT
jgi:hypothetical protein